MPMLVAYKLANGTPAVGVNTVADGIILNPYTMSVEDGEIAAQKIVEVVGSILPSVQPRPSKL